MSSRRVWLPVTFVLVAVMFGASVFLPFASAAAPAVVTNVVPIADDGTVTLTWNNPSSTDFTGTMVRYSTGGFPKKSTGTLAADVAGAPSGTSSTTVTGLSNGTTYYFSLFSHNAVPQYGAAAKARQLVMTPTFTDDF